MHLYLKYIFWACTVALLSACSTVVRTPQAPPSTPAQAVDAWASVLKNFVNEAGEVDFPALAKDRADLERYVRYVADTPLGQWNDPDAEMAHMVNAYNALSMFGVVHAGIPSTHAGLNKVGFFLLRKHQIGGKSMSLYAFENEVIRPLTRSQKDPRVHFALNCSALSCPQLPRTPFTGAALPQELERETRAFFAQPHNFRVDAQTRTVWLSEILKFYTEDFVPVPASSLIEYANRYAVQAAPLDYAVRFTPYDWTVANSQRADRQPADSQRSKPP